MRVHKLEPKDFKAIQLFSNACGAVLEREKFSFNCPEENWKDWDEEDDDKQEILRIRKYVAKNESLDEEDIDDRILMYEFLKGKYTHLLQLATVTADVLIDSCCDTTKSYLDFHPSFVQQHVAAEQ